MKVIACRLPDGTTERVAPSLPIIWWLQAGRTKEDIEGYIARAVAEGVKASKALALVETWMTPRENPTPYESAMLTGGLSEDEAYLVIGEKDCPDAVERLVSESVAPALSQYREACAPRGGKLVWDMDRARARHRDILRAARAPLLAAADVAFMRALEDGDTAKQAEIKAEKRALRDVTADPRIDAAQTVEELLNIGMPLRPTDTRGKT